MYVHSNQFCVLTLRYRILDDWAPAFSQQRRRFIRGKGDVLNGLQLREVRRREHGGGGRMGIVVPGSFFTIIIQTLGTDCLNICETKTHRVLAFVVVVFCARFESVCQLAVDWNDSASFLGLPPPQPDISLRCHHC